MLLKLFCLGLVLILIARILLSRRYKVVLSAPIYLRTKSKELGAWSSRKLSIPFAPYLGLMIHDGSGGVYKIDSVQWDCVEKNFRCMTTHELDFEYDSDEGYQHLKNSMQEFGWTIREVPLVTKNEHGE